MTSTPAYQQRSPVEQLVRRFYVRSVRPRLATRMAQQRLKLLWDVWGYYPLLADPALPLLERLAVIARMLRIDWNVPHAHKPRELAAVMRSIAQRRARDGEAVIEAGCWMGGGTAKLSVFCKLFGYELHTYDSFEGVEQRTDVEGSGTDFSGSYAASLAAVRANVARYGEPDVCHFHPGWFSETLEKSPPTFPVRGVYIDCDLVKGTAEVLAGVLAALVDDGWIYTQDYHIPSVRDLLHSQDLWARVGHAIPEIEHVCRNLARLSAPAIRNG